MAGTHNPLLPEMATVIETVQETHNIKTFRVRFDDEEKMKNFTFQPGQVGQLSVFGVGESTFVINSSPTRMDYLQFSVMKAGENTAALHKLNAGDKIGVRAPLGNWFPYEQWKGKNVFFIGGGIGVPPMLMTMRAAKENGAKPEAILGFRNQNAVILEDAFRRLGETHVCTDDGSYGVHGFVTDVLKLHVQEATAICACGPKPMLRAIAEIAEAQCIPCQVSMEERMGCGIGACLVCACELKLKDGQEGVRYGHVCKDGPVFDSKEVVW